MSGLRSQPVQNPGFEGIRGGGGMMLATGVRLRPVSDSDGKLALFVKYSGAFRPHTIRIYLEIKLFQFTGDWPGQEILEKGVVRRLYVSVFYQGASNSYRGFRR